LADRTLGGNAPEVSLEQGVVQPVLEGQIEILRSALASVTARTEMSQYIVDVVRATRSHDGVLLGAGPRGTQGLLLASRARAAMDGRDFVTPDDVRSMALSVLEHRIILRPESEVEGVRPSEVIEQIFNEVPVPR